MCLVMKSCRLVLMESQNREKNVSSADFRRQKDKDHRILLDVITVIFTVALVGINVLDQWRTTTKSQRASVYVIGMNCDVVNILKCH